MAQSPLCQANNIIQSATWQLIFYLKLSYLFALQNIIVIMATPRTQRCRVHGGKGLSPKLPHAHRGKTTVNDSGWFFWAYCFGSLKIYPCVGSVSVIHITIGLRGSGHCGDSPPHSSARRRYITGAGSHIAHRSRYQSFGSRENVRFPRKNSSKGTWD